MSAPAEGERPAVRPPDFLRDAWRIARKDLRIEARTRSGFLAAAVFAVLAVVIFRFTWDPTAIPAIVTTVAAIAAISSTGL